MTDLPYLLRDLAELEEAVRDLQADNCPQHIYLERERLVQTCILAQRVLRELRV